MHSSHLMSPTFWKNKHTSGHFCVLLTSFCFQSLFPITPSFPIALPHSAPSVKSYCLSIIIIAIFLCLLSLPPPSISHFPPSLFPHLPSSFTCTHAHTHLFHAHTQSCMCKYNILLSLTFPTSVGTKLTTFMISNFGERPGLHMAILPQNDAGVWNSMSESIYLLICSNILIV